jgi:hypothetical protein
MACAPHQFHGLCSSSLPWPVYLIKSVACVPHHFHGLCTSSIPWPVQLINSMACAAHHFHGLCSSSLTLTMLRIIITRSGRHIEGRYESDYYYAL